jgi:hypothetical protein
VARWLVAIRRTLFSQAKELLGASAGPLDRLLEDELEVTLSSFLISEAPPDRAALT